MRFKIDNQTEEVWNQPPTHIVDGHYFIYKLTEMGCIRHGEGPKYVKMWSLNGDELSNKCSLQSCNLRAVNREKILRGLQAVVSI